MYPFHKKRLDSFCRSSLKQDELKLTLRYRGPNVYTIIQLGEEKKSRLGEVSNRPQNDILFHSTLLQFYTKIVLQLTHYNGYTRVVISLVSTSSSRLVDKIPKYGWILLCIFQ